MFRSPREFRTLLAPAAAAVVIFGSSGLAYASGVQVSLASSFNADNVLRYSGSFTTPTISYDNSTPGGSVDNWLVTQSAANQLATSQGLTNPAPVGINDNGLYPASGPRLYDVQLGFTNTTPTGTNTVIRSSASGNFTFSVPNNMYSQFAIFGSGGSGNSTLTITLNYTTGSPGVLTGVTLPDWYSGNPSSTAASAAGTYFALTPAMARQAAYRFPSSGYQVPDAPGGAYIYGVNLAPDPTRVLASVQVAYVPSSPGYTVANFFTAAGAVATAAPPSTPVPGTLLLGLMGLSLVCWFYISRRRAAH